MLTEIEWWGGLLFLWLAACYALLRQGLADEAALSASNVLLHVAALLLGTLLTAYFYPLDSLLLQRSYLAAILLAALAVLAFTFWPDGPEAQEGAEESAQGGEEDEDDGPAALVVTLLLFAAPVLVVLVLASWKSRAFLDVAALLS